MSVDITVKFFVPRMSNCTVTVEDAKGDTEVLVYVQKNPGPPFYKTPSTDVLRRLVDKTLPKGVKREGARREARSGHFGKTFVYPVAVATS